jgi:hypothetical protein
VNPPMTDSREEAIWSLLRDRPVDDPRAPVGDSAPSRTNRDSLVALLDAALGMLSATRHLVEVAEDVVRDQRDRIASESESEQRAPGDEQSPSAQRRKIDLSY